MVAVNRHHVQNNFDLQVFGLPKPSKSPAVTVLWRLWLRIFMMMMMILVAAIPWIIACVYTFKCTVHGRIEHRLYIFFLHTHSLPLEKNILSRHILSISFQNYNRNYIFYFIFLYLLVSFTNASSISFLKVVTASVSILHENS